MLGKDMSRREAMKMALKAGAYAAPVVLVAAVPTAVAAQVSGITPVCTRPLTRLLAPSGSGTAGTSQTTTACTGGGYIQTFQVTLTGAPANTRYDVYLDQESVGSASSHLFAGTFTTNAAGDATFSASIRVPTPVTMLDNEIVANDPTRSNYTSHEFAQISFAPCPVSCPPLPIRAAIPGPPLTGVGTARDK